MTRPDQARNSIYIFDPSEPSLRIFWALRVHLIWFKLQITGFKHTQTRSLEHRFRCLDIYLFFTKLLFYENSLKALRKLSKSKLSESSLKAPRKQTLWKLSESSTKAGSPKSLPKLSEISLKALRKQADFCQKPLKNKLALPKQDDFCRKLYKSLSKSDNTNFYDKIVYVGGPSFRRRPWPFWERRSHVPQRSTTLSVTEAFYSTPRLPSVQYDTLTDIIAAKTEAFDSWQLNYREEWPP